MYIYKLSVNLAELYLILKIRLMLVSSTLMFSWVLVLLVLECWLVKSSVRILFMVLIMMFSGKEQQEARARNMTLREEDQENHEPSLHLMPMLNWFCQCRYAHN